MGKILSKDACDKIKALNKKFAKYADKGWMCEGGEYEENGKIIPCNNIFNNDTDEFIRGSYDGQIITYVASSVGLEGAKEMAQIQGEVRRITDAD